MDEKYSHRLELSKRNATDAQLSSLRAFYGANTPGGVIKMDAATKMLSVRDYVRGVALLFERRGAVVTHKHMLETCLNVLDDPKLTDFIFEWNQRRLARGTMGDLPTRLRDTPEKVLVGEYLLMNIEVWGY